LQNNIKQTCNLVASIHGGLVAWWHESLQRGSMECVRQESLQGKALLGGDAFLKYT